MKAENSITFWRLKPTTWLLTSVKFCLGQITAELIAEGRGGGHLTLSQLF